MQKPTVKPARPNFSSGPCAKRPGWTTAVLDQALLGRSHRSAPAKAQLKSVIDRHRALLNIPDDYLVAITPASDTGAIEMCLWNMLGPRGVDVLAWENFSREWATDIVDHLKIPDTRVFDVPYGQLPDLRAVDPQHRDVVFVWNGTTSGVRLPHADWVPDTRAGLTFCDATSAVFAYDLPWQKLDVTTWSWQKVAGGEAAHGMIALSPRAVERLQTYIPPRPLPKIFRLTEKGKLIDGIFKGEVINTPSMMAVADCLDSLDWVESVGGLSGMMGRCAKNAGALRAWVQKTDWIDELCAEESARSITSVCLKVVDPWFTAQDTGSQEKIMKDVVAALDTQGVAHDIASYRGAAPGLRIWCGATVEASDIENLTPWLDWAYETIKSK